MDSKSNIAIEDLRKIAINVKPLPRPDREEKHHKKHRPYYKNAREDLKSWAVQ